MAFTDSSGGNQQDQLVYTRDGGGQAGGITASNGFDNARSGTPEGPRLSFYRNRYYDQETGRWTQEDPIGIAGGVNLYQYAGNSPMAFVDPFGLEVCLQSTQKDKNKAGQEVQALKKGLENHTQTTFDLDDSNCVTNVQPAGSDFTEIGARFYEIAGNPNYVVNAQIGPCCSYNGQTRLLTLNLRAWTVMAYKANLRNGSCPNYENEPYVSATSIFWHEFGHVYEHMATGATDDEPGNWGMHYENLWNRQNGRPERCAYD